MTSNQISCFLSAARNLNFTVAAEECYITQPALSRSISSLEEDLGVKLFERTNNNLALTPGGERLYKFFDEQSKAFSSVVNNAKFDNDRDHNRLTIGFVRNEFMATKDVDALDVFIKQNPDIKVNFKHFQSAREAIESAITQKVDVIEIMEAAALKTPMLRHVSICEYKRCVVVSRQSVFANKTAMSLSEFKDETFIAIKPEHSSTMLDTVLRVCREAGFSPKNVIEAADIQELINMVEDNVGVALLYTGHAQLNNPLIHCVELKEYLPINQLLAWNGANENPNIAKCLEVMTNR